MVKNQDQMSPESNHF